MIIIIINKRNNSFSAPTFPNDQIARLNDEVKSLAVSSEETQVLNREHHIEGFVAISDSGRSGARKVLLTHPSGATCEIYTKGASVASWTLPNGGEVLFTPGLSYNFPHWDGFDLFAKKRL